jgi:hypothetical protein
MSRHPAAEAYRDWDHGPFACKLSSGDNIGKLGLLK